MWQGKQMDFRTMKKRIFLACADENLRLAMLLLLDHEPGMVVVGIADRLQGLVSQLETTQTNVLLLEWELPCQEMIELFTNIHHLDSQPKIIYISSSPEEEDKMRADGADYVIIKNAPPDQLLPLLNQLDVQSGHG